uniref:Protein kinase domain-containing protein n=1 Tax=Pyrodinium bahamense TaxID=73915 RepID=A0A7S0FFF7_9DINO
MEGACCDLARLLGFVALHLASYAANVATMVIVCMTGHRKYLAVLLPVHATIGVFCTYTAAVNCGQRRWNPCVCLFVVVVMGAMQGVQVKLAHDDYLQRCAVRRGAVCSELEVPATMPARFHCKAVDGILEGTFFAAVSMYALLKRNWAEFDGVMLLEWQSTVLYLGACFSFLTTGLALMEVDHRTSTAVQQILDCSTMAQARHLAFRACELSCRLLTVLGFCTLMRPVPGLWWLAFIIVAVDYLLGVLLLVLLGGRDPVRQASLLLGIPLFFVNIMQFVDAPGMSLQARRISSIVVPLRAAELLAVVAYTATTTCTVKVLRPGLDGAPSAEEEALPMLAFLLQLRPRWVAAWALSAFGHYALLATYACRVKPGVDLHSAVAYGEVGSLRELLCGSELVLDINRYGPDGRAPLHLAALRGQVDCIRLLVTERANLHLRTGNRTRNTALHLAAMGQSPAAVRCLKQLGSDDPEFLNAANVDGDTAIHVAARRHNLGAVQELLREPSVNFRLKNCKGESPADFAVNPRNFFFDRNSPEFMIQELFQNAEAGRPPSQGASGSLELSNLGEHTSGSSEPRADGDVPPGSPGCPADGASAEDSSAWAAEVRHDAQQYHVPLLTVGSDAEQELLRRTSHRADAAGQACLAVTNCGISSFMLSAGLGALSRTFLSSIREDSECCSPDGLPATQVSFEDFVDVKKLGEGAFGKVNLVRHKETGELFAMKLMDKAKFRAQKITSKAHSEQYILKTTRHPFIVSLHYAFQGSIFWVLVMEFCPNGDLQGALCTYGTPGLPLPECARLSGEVLLAIEHLHAIQVIFRDLKPENVVLDADYRAKITDFGLAKKLYSSADAQTMCGSWGYVAPEITTSKAGYTYAVDLYSFGVMLYLLVSGGEESTKKPQRLPPMRHAELRRKLRAAEKEESKEWMKPDVGALALLSVLTSENPRVRTTATEVKGHAFFARLLGRPVDSLLSERGPFGPPGTGPARAAAPAPAAPTGASASAAGAAQEDAL